MIIPAPSYSHLNLIGKGKERDRRPAQDKLDELIEWFETNPRQLISMGRIVRYAVVTTLRQEEICKPEWPLVDMKKRCVEDAELQATALDVAVNLSNGAQSAIRWTKYALNNWLRVNGPLFDTSNALEILGFTEAEAREGLAAHLQKAESNISPGMLTLILA
jgi:hypothetical protein